MNKTFFTLLASVCTAALVLACAARGDAEMTLSHMSPGQAHNERLDSLISEMMNTRSASSLYEYLQSSNSETPDRRISDIGFNDLSDAGKNQYAALNERLLHLNPAVQDTSDLIASIIQWNGQVQSDANLEDEEKSYLHGLGDIAVHSIRYWSDHDSDLIVSQLEATLERQGNPSQGRTVTGRIFDEFGEPVPGATITCLPYQIGTVSNIEGYFILFIPNGEQIISITMIGYKEKRYRIGTASDIGHVILQDDYDILDDSGQTNPSTLLTKLGYLAASDALGAISNLEAPIPGANVCSLLAAIGYLL